MADNFGWVDDASREPGIGIYRSPLRRWHSGHHERLDGEAYRLAVHEAKEGQRRADERNTKRPSAELGCPDAQNQRSYGANPPRAP